MNIYLSGPIYKCDDDEKRTWREELKLLRPEHTYFDPCDLGFTEADYETHYNQIVREDLALIYESDLVVCSISRPSIGTAMELWEARDNGISIVIITEIRHAWLLYVSNGVLFKNIESALPTIDAFARR